MMNHRLSKRYTLPATRCKLYAMICSTTVENIRQITPFYAKQTQFYAIFARKSRFNEKTNPIQSQFKANLTQNKPNLTQFKAKTNPIPSEAKVLSVVEGSRKGKK